MEQYAKCIRQNFLSLLKNRNEAMGVAMIMVLLYHLYGSWFYPGFLGVDIFLFLSAYGLCRSLELNSLSDFYIHRIQRIMPLYFLMGAIVSFIYVYNYNAQLTWWDVLCNLTSLNYWGGGGNVSEWYLSFLLLIYLLFPFLFWGCRLVSGSSMGGVILIAIILTFVLLLLTKDLKWYYETAIGRIPIFMMGILCYPFSVKSSELAKKCTLIFTLAFIWVIVLFSFGKIETYVLLYMLAPLCLNLVGLLLRNDNKAFKKILSVVGKYSLEIYVANVIVVLYRKAPGSLFDNKGFLFTTLVYFLLNFVMAIVLVYINCGMKRYGKWQK